MTYHELQLMD